MKPHISGLVKVILPAICLASCEREYRSVSLPDTVYIESFPFDTIMEGNPSTGIDLMGAQNIRICDSLMVFYVTGADYFWKTVNLNDVKKTGSMLQAGQGPDEWVYAPTSLRRINYTDSVSFSAWDYNRGRLVMGKTAFSEDGTPGATLSTKEMSNLRDATDVIPVNDSTCFVSIMDLSNGSIRRGMYRNGQIADLQNLGSLAEATSDQGNLAFIPVLNENGTRVAEAMTRLNQINLYSLDDNSIRKTLTTAEKLDNFNEVEHKNRKDIIRCYTAVDSFRDVFVALYVGASRKDVSDGDFTSEFQVYDWNGSPIARIRTDKPIISCAVDDNGIIYGLDNNGDSEKIYTWNLNEILARHR